ncbi:nucleoplasmin-like [Ambystoma mexicanum]|uniref:nucleoplasmin-like n=1 Tax=Ambystoma mexicanum TaxID=8296 RepID=UPI0037E74A79
MEAQVAAGESPAPLHMEARAAAEQRGAPLRTHSFLFGCVLSATQRKVSFPGGGDDLREQLTLRTVSLGLGAGDKLHVLEVQGETQEGSVARVPVATMRPSLLTSVYLGGLELTPPVTLWLTAGRGPLCISGQHLVALREREAEAVRAVAKRKAAAMASAEREAAQAAAKREAVAKASAERREAAAKALGVQTDTRLAMTAPMLAFPPSNRNYAVCTAQKAAQHPLPSLVQKEKSPLVEEMKTKLVSLSLREPGRIPNTRRMFRKFAYYMFYTSGQIVEDLWEFVLSENLNKPPATKER